jgi:hypothetical protein
MIEKFHKRTQGLQITPADSARTVLAAATEVPLILQLLSPN